MRERAAMSSERLAYMGSPTKREDSCYSAAVDRCRDKPLPSTLIVPPAEPVTASLDLPRNLEEPLMTHGISVPAVSQRILVETECVSSLAAHVVNGSDVD
jgi:hypothetical protein